MSSKSCIQDYFLVIPQELVLQIMASLPLKDRLSLMQAYPKFQSLGQDRHFKTRVITSSETSITNKKDLEKLLDPTGTHVQFSLNFSSTLVGDNSLTINTLYLMPNLQEVSFKDCKLDMEVCQCESDTMCSIECSFWNLLLARVAIVKIDNCTIATYEGLNYFAAWYRWTKLLRKHLRKAGSPLREANLSDTLLAVDGLKAITCAMVFIVSPVMSVVEFDIRFIAEDHNGKSLNIASLEDSTGTYSQLRNRLFECSKPLSKIASRSPQERTLPFKFKNVQIKVDGSSDIDIKVIDDFDLTRFESELQAL